MKIPCLMTLIGLGYWSSQEKLKNADYNYSPIGRYIQGIWKATIYGPPSNENTKWPTCCSNVAQHALVLQVKYWLTNSWHATLSQLAHTLGVLSMCWPISSYVVKRWWHCNSFYSVHMYTFIPEIFIDINFYEIVLACKKRKIAPRECNQLCGMYMYMATYNHWTGLLDYT